VIKQIMILMLIILSYISSAVAQEGAVIIGFDEYVSAIEENLGIYYWYK
jgi:hypothetical protein